MTTLDHVTLRTSHVAVTRQFFIDLFNLKEGSRPLEIQHISGCWLYSGEEPIVHLIESFDGGFSIDGEMIDHIAFRLDDYSSFMSKIRMRNIPFSQMSLKELGEHRVFLRAPGGQLIETVFRGDAAKVAFAENKGT
ncbi:MAG: VOC family protein [Pseudoruegeria sp.]